MEVNLENMTYRQLVQLGNKINIEQRYRDCISTNTMFTDEFLNEIKTVYPKFTILHHAILENNRPLIEDYLRSGKDFDNITVDEILEITSLEELKEKAKLIKRREQLYKDFLNGECYKDE